MYICSVFPGGFYGIPVRARQPPAALSLHSSEMTILYISSGADEF